MADNELHYPDSDTNVTEEKHIIDNIIETVNEAPVMAIVKKLSNGAGYAATVTWGHFSTLSFGVTREEVLESIDRHTGRYAGKDRLVIFSDVCPETDPKDDPEDRWVNHW